MASIEKRSDNTYRITVSDGYDNKRKKLRKRKIITLDSNLTERQKEKELEKQAALFEDEVRKGIYLDAGKITFAEFIERWLKDYAETQLQPKTLYRYKEMLGRINSSLGHIRLDRLQPMHLIEFYTNLQEVGIRKDILYIAKPELVDLIKSKHGGIKKASTLAGISENTTRSILSGHTTNKAADISKALNIPLKAIFTPVSEEKPLSGRTILHHHRLISSILTTAVHWQIILYNPAERVKPPKVEKNETAHYDEDMTEDMLNLLDNEPIKYRTMIVLTVFAGVRRGELCGLEWSDVDFESNKLRIRQASQYIPGKGLFTKKPKNDSSMRLISMPSVAMELLSEYKAWQNEERLKLGELWENNDRIFTKWNGSPIFPDTISRWFRQFRLRHNLPELKFHGLRHTNASLLIGQGVDIQTVSKRLGHARTSTTTDIYAHALRRPDIEAAEKLDGMFNKKKKSEQSKQA